MRYGEEDRKREITREVTRWRENEIDRKGEREKRCKEI